MRVRFILRFLLISWVSILFSVSNRFLLLQIIEVYNEEKHWIQFTPVILSSKRGCQLVWKLAEYTFNHYTYICKKVRCEKSKQTVNVSQDRYKISSCWNNLFQDKQIICLCQADSASKFYAKEYNFDKSSSIK